MPEKKSKNKIYIYGQIYRNGGRDKKKEDTGIIIAQEFEII